jgi:hypothetical protein
MRRFIRISLSLCFAAVVGFVLLLIAAIHAYSSLTDETLIAEIEFDRVGEQQYIAQLRTGDFCEQEIFTVLGDQWRVDAQFLKWRYFAALFGLESHYRLERFEGRYRSVGEQNVRPTLAHALAPPSAIDIGGLADRLGRMNFLADASYGSSTYHDIDPTETYLVYKSPTGIFTRARPRSSPQLTGEALSVEVRRGCAEDAGLVTRAAGWVNRTVDRVD